MQSSDNDNTTSKIRIQGVKQPKLYDWMYCDCIVQGEKFVDATHMTRRPTAHTRKLNAKEYVVLSTGEIKEYQEKLEPKRQKENLYRTFNRIRHLIRHNFTDEGDNQLFITLTYKENMTDTKRLMKDYQHFMQRLKRYYRSHTLDYITIAEPQGRGAWHMHVLLKSDKPVLIIDNKDTWRLWGQGFTSTKRLKADDVGTYFTSYFTDLIVDEEGKELTEEEIAKLPPEEISKKRVKGSRLHMYPQNFKFFRKSQGIEEPINKRLELKDIKAEYGEPVYIKGYECIKEEKDLEPEVLTAITKINFKRGTPLK